MKNDFFKLYLRLMNYAAFMSVIGSIASFMGPPHSGLVKACIGVVIGAMLLGRRLPLALKELRSITDDISDEIFPDNTSVNF